jgi:hypothetical protein
MRVRLEEMLERFGMTPYRLAKESGGRISLAAAYRLHQNGGHFEMISAPVLQALCDVFGKGPSEILEWNRPKGRARGASNR